MGHQLSVSQLFSVIAFLEEPECKSCRGPKEIRERILDVYFPLAPHHEGMKVSWASNGGGACTALCLEDHDSCGADGSLADLPYSCDEGYYFLQKCNSYTNWFQDRYLWAYWDMFHEDKIYVSGHPGQDWWTVDDSIDTNLFVYWSGHGATYGNYPHDFKGSTCGIYGINYFSGSAMILGERLGYYSTPYSGSRILDLDPSLGEELEGFRERKHLARPSGRRNTGAFPKTAHGEVVRPMNFL